METLNKNCPKCGGPCVKNGKTKLGIQKYKCKHCLWTFAEESHQNPNLNPPCPKCGGLLKSFGRRNGGKRLRCKSCGYYTQEIYTKRGKNIDPDTIKLILNYRNAGITYSDLAKNFNICESSVYNVLRKYKLQLNKEQIRREKRRRYYELQRDKRKLQS